jgi:hypothetical protein
MEQTICQSCAMPLTSEDMYSTEKRSRILYAGLSDPKTMEKGLGKALANFVFGERD